MYLETSSKTLEKVSGWLKPPMRVEFLREVNVSKSWKIKAEREGEESYSVAMVVVLSRSTAQVIDEIHPRVNGGQKPGPARKREEKEAQSLVF